MGQIYKGLAQTGAWGCFDEFNRIPVAVLSVCSTQYKVRLLPPSRPDSNMHKAQLAPAVLLQDVLSYGPCCNPLMAATQRMLFTQTVLDALRARMERFTFEEVEMRLRPSVMAFITMNPGYPGRAELPESLKVCCT